MIVKRTADAGSIQHTFAFGKKKLIRAFFGSEQQTRIGGAPLLLEFELTIGLVAGAAACMKDYRASGQVTYSLYQLLWLRVLLICCGFEDVLDWQLLAHDPGLDLAMAIEGEVVGLPSQATGCRFENGISSTNCMRLAIWLIWSYITSKKCPPKSVRLDFDGSCVPAHGQQQGTSYRKYYDCQMYFPLFVFDEDGVLITAILRPGSDGEARMTVPVLKRLVGVFRKAWPGVEILVVMDSAFSDPAIYDWCEDHDVYYLIKLRNAGHGGGGLFSHSHEMAADCKESFGRRFGTARYSKTKTSKAEIEKAIRAKSDKKERKKELEELGRRLALRYGEFMYQTGKGGNDPKQWRQRRRVLASCAYDDWGSHRTFWVTNYPSGDPEHLINHVYSRRGVAELRIKDAKAFRCDKLSCEKFVANQFRLLVHVLAQRLLFQFRSRMSETVQRMALESIREQFIRIPALIREKARIIELVWAADFPFKNVMHGLCSRLARDRQRPPDWFTEFQSFVKPALSLS